MVKSQLWADLVWISVTYRIRVCGENGVFYSVILLIWNFSEFFRLLLTAEPCKTQSVRVRCPLWMASWLALKTWRSYRNSNSSRTEFLTSEMFFIWIQKFPAVFQDEVFMQICEKKFLTCHLAIKVNCVGYWIFALPNPR